MLIGLADLFGKGPVQSATLIGGVVVRFVSPHRLPSWLYRIGWKHSQKARSFAKVPTAGAQFMRII
jgi:hypothetical protein